MWVISTSVHVQSCLTLCDPMDCSPPGFSVHGILQARVLEWASSPGHLPNPGVKFTSSESPALSDRFLTTEPLMGSPLRILEPIALSFSRGSSRPRDRTCVSCISRLILYHWATRILLQLTFFCSASYNVTHLCWYAQRWFALLHCYMVFLCKRVP